MSTDKKAGFDTKQRLIECGEELFAKHGIEGVPLRLISREAGQKNKSSVEYHFGSREGLIEAILEYRAIQFEDQRRVMMEKFTPHEVEHDLNYLMHVFLDPPLRLYYEKGSLDYLKMTAQYLTVMRPRGVRHPVDQVVSTPNLRRALELIYDRLSFMSFGHFSMRLESVAAMFLTAILKGHLRYPDRQDLFRLITDDAFTMMIAALRAPVDADLASALSNPIAPSGPFVP